MRYTDELKNWTTWELNFSLRFTKLLAATAQDWMSHRISLGELYSLQSLKTAESLFFSTGVLYSHSHRIISCLLPISTRFFLVRDVDSHHYRTAGLFPTNFLLALSSELLQTQLNPLTQILDKAPLNLAGSSMSFSRLPLGSPGKEHIKCFSKKYKADGKRVSEAPSLKKSWL